MPSRRTQRSSSEAAATPVRFAHDDERSNRSGLKRRISDASVQSSGSELNSTPSQKRRKRPSRHSKAVDIEHPATIEEANEETNLDVADARRDASLDDLSSGNTKAGQHISVTTSANATTVTPQVRKWTLFSLPDIFSSTKKNPVIVNGGTQATTSDTVSSHVATLSSSSQSQKLRSLKDILEERKVTRLAEKRAAQDKGELAAMASDPLETLLVIEDVTMDQGEMPPREHNRSESTPTAQLPPRKSLQAQWDEERSKFQDVISHYSQESETARARAATLAVEVESLGFPGESTSKILQNIRFAFESAQAMLRQEVSFSLPEGELGNADVLDVLVAAVRQFAAQSSALVAREEKSKQIRDELQLEIDTLITSLADSDIEKAEYQKHSRELIQLNGQMEETIQGYAATVYANESEIGRLQTALDDALQDAVNIRKEHQDLESSADSLKAALTKYIEEGEKLTSTITQLEAEHELTVVSISKEHEATKQRLFVETTAHKSAEEQIARYQRQFEELQKQLIAVTRARDNISSHLEDAERERDEEASARADAEDMLLLSRKDYDGLRVEHDRVLEIAASRLKAIDHLSVEARAKADEIAKLEAKLADQGKQANELRSKLWDIQQAHAAETNEKQSTIDGLEKQNNHLSAKIQQIETIRTAKDKELEEILTIKAELEQDLNTEYELRLEAHRLAEERATRIAELETNIGSSNVKLQEALTESNHRATELKAARDKLTRITKAKKGLEGDAKTLQAGLENQRKMIADLEAEKEELITGAIDAEQKHDAAIEERNAMITDLSNSIQAHAEQIVRSEARIDTLTTQNAQLKDKNDELVAKCESLEQRVSSEAENFLQMESEKAAEIEARDAIIADKQAKILSIQQKAREADGQWTQMLEAKNDEIGNLQSSVDYRQGIIASLRAREEALENRIRVYVRRQAHGLVENLETVIRGDGEEVVHDLESVSETHMHAAVQRTRGKRRNVDSGIGLDGDDDTIVVAQAI